jgi:predicted alpha/beta hydrolase
VDVETLTPDEILIYGKMCGWTLARAHARSGDRVAISAYLGTNDSFDQALAVFAVDYADQNQRDFQALADAVKIGRVKAQTGV